MNRVKPNNLFSLLYWITLVAYLGCYVVLSKKVNGDIVTDKNGKVVVDVSDKRPEWYRELELKSKSHFDDFVKEVF